MPEVAPFWKARSQRWEASTYWDCAPRAVARGEVIAEEQVQAARKEDVLNALGQMASKLQNQAR